MAADWYKMSLREAGVTLIDCDHRTPPAAEFGYPYVSIPQLRGGRVDVSNVRRITRDHYAEWTRKAKPRVDDVILSRRCNPGETAIVPADLEFALGQNLVLLRSDGGKVYPPFLRWLARGPEWWEQIGKFINVGAVFDSLRCADVPKFEFSIPPIAEQRAISDVLGSLDDGIDLNRRMSETLETMARALYKSWFVDFDPVRARGEGQTPSVPAPLANLFPTRLADSQLGEIPEGWTLGRFTDVVEQMRDQVNPLASPDSVFHHYSIPAFDEGQRPSVDLGDSIKSQKWRVFPGAILLSKLNPEIERVWLVDVERNERAVCSTEFLVFHPRTPYDRSYVYCLARSPTFRQQIEALVTGTSKSHQRAQADVMLGLPVVLPPKDLAVAFQEIASPLLDRLLACRRESNALVALRDALLPRLISGELRVREGEQVAEQVT